MDIHHGVFVDIFLLHNCPESKIKQKWLSFWEKYLSFKDLANKEYHRKGGLWGMVLNIQKLLPKRFLVKYALKQVYRYKSEECPYRCHLYDNIPLYKGIYPKEWFGHSVLMPFENTELYGMGEYADVYLKAFYGDYMKIPSLEQIRYKQHSSEWSTEKPFTPRKSGSFADEKYL
ncbi:MAG: LicD family protein, partial [Bacteroidaceae bacterium]|nr:LicD family protein [Bacteroidaceae bacterium]